jgi:hypothetical protein
VAAAAFGAYAVAKASAHEFEAALLFLVELDRLVEAGILGQDAGGPGGIPRNSAKNAARTLDCCDSV